MTARQPILRRWTETAEAEEVCAMASLEREPQPGAACPVAAAGTAPFASRRPRWPRVFDWLPRPGIKSMGDDGS